MPPKPIRRLPLDGLTHQYGTLEPDASVGYNVYHVHKPSALIQAAGYLKHLRAVNQKAVYFRGQETLYPSLKPSLYRALTQPRARNYRDDKLNRYLKKIRTERQVMRAVPPHVHEPMLQHYGLRTRWLDVVDNVWVALWFACHSAHAVGEHGQYLHFQKRVERHTTPSARFAYILLLEAATTPSAKEPGCFRDNASAAIDLRIAAPSQFVRPHAQHGLVIQAIDAEGRAALDFSKLLVGIIRVHLADALEWLGQGDLLNVHALFPPPPYDSGYHEILTHITITDKVIGAVNHIGA
jgi:hypothetical protein